MPHAFTFVAYSVEDGAAWIRLNRPDALNAFSIEFYGELRTAIRLADQDPSVDVIVITGVGRAFATGGDLKQALQSLEGKDPLAIMGFVDNSPMQTLREATKTTVAAVNGICMAGGLIISGLCDLVVAARSATFALPEARVGLAEAMSVSVLYPHVPLHCLKYMAFTGSRLSAQDALRIGLVNEVVEDECLGDRTRALIREVRATDPQARRAYKHYFNRLVPPLDHATTISPGLDVSRLAAFANRDIGDRS